jgi:MFS family permease
VDKQTEAQNSQTDNVERIGGSARLLFAGYLLSAIGSGTVYPYMAIYVQQVRGLGGTVAAFALSIIALGTVAGSLVAGRHIDWMGPLLVGSAGLILQAAGYSLIGVSAELGPLLAACALIGTGAGMFLAVLSPVISAICPPPQHRRAFAARYMANNLGLGIGALIALIALSKFDAARFTLLYEINAASYIVFLVMFCSALSIRPSELRQPTLAVGENGNDYFRWRDLLRNRPFVQLLAVQVLLVAGGFSQMQSVIPLLLRVRLAEPPKLITTLLVMNCLGIVLVQPLVVRLCARLSETHLLTSVGATWALAFAVGAGAMLRGSIGIAAIMLFGAVFTVGECCYGPSFQTLVVQFAPPRQLGRYSGVASSLWGAVTFIAPPLGVLLVDSHWPYTIFLFCGLSGVLASLCTLRLPSSVFCR